MTTPTRTWSGKGNRTVCRVETDGLWRGTIRTSDVQDTTGPGLAGHLVWHVATYDHVWLDPITGERLRDRREGAARSNQRTRLKETRMPSKTRDLEAAICADLTHGHLAVGEILDRFGGIDDPRWVMVALVHLRRDNVIRYVGCGSEHNHGGDCRVELNP